MVAGMGAAPT